MGYVSKCSSCQTHPIICNMAYLGQYVTFLTSDDISSKMLSNLSVSNVYESIRFDERNTMMTKLLVYHK